MTPAERRAEEMSQAATAAWQEAQRARAAAVAQAKKEQDSKALVRQFLSAYVDRMVLSGIAWNPEAYRDWLATLDPEAQLLNHCRKSLILLTDPIVGVSNLGDGRLAWHSKVYKDLKALHHGFEDFTAVDMPFLVFNGLIRAIVAGLDPTDPRAVTQASLDAIAANVPLPEPTMDDLTVTDALYLSGLLGFLEHDPSPMSALVSAHEAAKSEA